MNKKLTWGFIALIAAIIIVIVLILLTRAPETPSEKILLKDGTPLPAVICGQLQKVTVIHAAGCSACAIAIPRLRELEEELNMTFSYYDLAVEQEKQAILDYGLIPEAVPTAIINCKVYVGVRSKEEYKKALY